MHPHPSHAAPRASASPHPLRSALLRAVLGRPTRLPHPASVDLGAFWARFDAEAPAHLRWGLDLATLLLGVLLPALIGPRPTLAAMSEDEREVFIQRAAALPGCAQLVEVVKIVAGLAYFSNDHTEDAARQVKP